MLWFPALWLADPPLFLPGQRAGVPNKVAGCVTVSEGFSCVWTQWLTEQLLTLWGDRQPTPPASVSMPMTRSRSLLRSVCWGQSAGRHEPPSPPDPRLTAAPSALALAVSLQSALTQRSRDLSCSGFPWNPLPSLRTRQQNRSCGQIWTFSSRCTDWIRKLTFTVRYLLYLGL